MNSINAAKRGEYPDMKELSENVAIVLALWRAGSLHYRVAQQVVKGAIWWASNAQGKNRYSPYWTRAAKEQLEDNKSRKRLINEHVIPRSVLEEAILCIPCPSADCVYEILKYSVTCLVTNAEDKRLAEQYKHKMPECWDWGKDPFMRYKSAGIEYFSNEVIQRSHDHAQFPRSSCCTRLSSDA